MNKLEDVYKPEKEKVEELSIEKLYYKLAQLYHPDKTLGYEELMIKLNEAYNKEDRMVLEEMYKEFILSEPGDKIDIVV